MCILFWHFRRYVIIRHSYLTRGACVRGWMDGCVDGWVGGKVLALGCNGTLRPTRRYSHRLTHSHSLTHTHSLTHPGDDPNYWMALTHQADVKNISKKVKRMLLDLNLASEPGGPVSARVCVCVALGVALVLLLLPTPALPTHPPILGQPSTHPSPPSIHLQRSRWEVPPAAPLPPLQAPRPPTTRLP